MLITGAALVNRFYAIDGWTIQSVADMLDDPSTLNVTARYDRESSSGVPATPGEPISYFAVYDHETTSSFLKSKVDEHEYEPFSDGDHDARFADKNRTIDDTTPKKPKRGKR